MAASVPQQLLRFALPLIPKSGFTAHSLQLASLSLPAPHTPPAPGYTTQTLNGLFPSPPPLPYNSARSLSREELKADAQGSSLEGERVGPARALVHEWLEEGRRDMVGRIREVGLRGEAGVREGLRQRVRYNEPVLGQLVQALALLGAPTTTALSSHTALLPFPSPAPHLTHVARIAHDLAKVSGDDSQGADWYLTRSRLGTIYGLAELHLLSPSNALTSAERVESTLELVDALLDRSRSMQKSVEGAGQFAEWVGKSWMGMGRSLGL